MSIVELKHTLDQYKEKKVNPVEIRHVLMKTYGWMSEREFYEECSIDEVLKLVKLISADAEREQRMYDKAKRGRRG